MPPSIDFRAIRSYAGSQNRGFEELCYQLLPVLVALPATASLVRHGTPDGGVEMRATLEDGSVWAWQAKYLFALGDGEFGQLDRSVREALDAQPALARYIFCLPYNRPAANVPGRKSAMQRWEEHGATWSRWAESKGMRVVFDFIGESELLRALLTPGQEGRARYWFDATILTPSWFEAGVKSALKRAGPRYTPELNVDLPIAEVFEGLGRTPRFGERLRASLGTIRKERRVDTLSRPPLTDGVIAEQAAASNALLDDLDRRIMEIDVSSTTTLDFEGIGSCCTAAVKGIEAITEMFHERAREMLTAPEGAQRSESLGEDRASRLQLEAETWRGKAWSLRPLINELRDLRSFVVSESARLANRPAMLLAGRPGVGKTHLLCDVSSMRVSHGLPTVLLLGQTFTREEPWSQVLKQLHLKCGVDEFLGALNTAAETQNVRALIIVDAINEGEGIDLWPDYLSEFVAEILKWPRVGVALACRTNYVNQVVPPELDGSQLIRIAHNGFVGVEYRAVKEFFRHFKLRLPDFPLLEPEFQNPLFLKLMCSGLRDRGETTMPRGATGVTELFERFLDGVNRRLSRHVQCDFAPDERLVWWAVDAIAMDMLDKGQEWIPFRRAKSLLDALLPQRPWSRSLLHGLLSEGVLMQDHLEHQHDEEAEVVQFAYQRLGDHRRAAIFCGRSDTAEILASKLSTMLAEHGSPYRYSGLLEALAIQVPERYGRELYELVPDPQHNRIQDAYLESLIWRNTSSFARDFPGEYLQGIANSGSGWAPTLDVFVHVACLPEHPLNARRLHRLLYRLSLTDRDQWWSIEYLYWRGRDDSAPIMRLLRWAREEDTASCADDGALLAAIALTWCLTSPDRSLRDDATKAVVRLLLRRYGVLLKLLRLFRDVNDPYVAERVYAIAYGCCLMDRDQTGIRRVAAWVYHNIFEHQTPPPHLLLRDYARGIFERALALDCAPVDMDLARVRPPYRSRWPLHAPAEVSLRRRLKGEEADWTPWFSVMHWDFRRYVLDDAVRHFLAPNQQRRLAALRREAQAANASAAEQFLDSLDVEQLARFLALDDTDSRRSFVDALSQPQREALHTALRTKQQSRSPNEPLRFDSGLAARWVMARVLALGWTPKRFGLFDRTINRDGNRGVHTEERMGKKYQWTALHELLAHVADHCKVLELWTLQDKEPRWLGGPWELGRRDIDPSLQMRDTGAMTMPSQGCWWVRMAPHFPPVLDGVKRNAWLRADVDASDLIKLIRPRDAIGTDWITLGVSAEWRADMPPEIVDRYSAGQCVLWVQLRGYLVHRQDCDAFIAWLGTVDDLHHSALPASGDASGIFLGEYPWHPASGALRASWAEPAEYGLPVAVGPTGAGYTGQQNEYDASVGEGVHGTLPSTVLVEELGLSWQGIGFRYQDARGRLVAWDPSAEAPGPSALLIRLETLSRYLEHRDLTLVWTLVGEKHAFGSATPHGLDGLQELRGFLSFRDGEVHVDQFVARVRRLDGQEQRA